MPKTMTEWVEDELVAMSDPHQPQSRKAQLEHLRDMVNEGEYGEISRPMANVLATHISFMIRDCTD